MKNVDELYSIDLYKENDEKENISYRKNIEKFNDDDYAIVTAYSKDKKMVNNKFYGIINKEYETIVKFKNYRKIEYLGNSNYLVQFDNFETHHIIVKDDKIKLVKIFKKYKKLNNNYLVLDLVNLVYLYDVCKHEIVSCGFNLLEEYKDGFYAERNLKNIEASVSCFLDKNGKIKENVVYNQYKNEYETLNTEFDAYINENNKNILVKNTKEEKKKILEEEILKKKLKKA